LTAFSASGSDDNANKDAVFVVETVVDPDDGYTGNLIQDAIPDDVLLYPSGKLMNPVISYKKGSLNMSLQQTRVAK
jgi:hypothetical protein